MQALPNEVAILFVPSMLVEQNLTSAEETNVEINKLEALKMATRALSRSLKFQPLNVSCWHDLALSYHYQIIAGEGKEQFHEFLKFRYSEKVKNLIIVSHVKKLGGCLLTLLPSQNV